jgi:predicted molibdopterin-dependent oxidoreductase YjgC
LCARRWGALGTGSNSLAVSKPYLRLTHPLVREGEVLRRATWDEALDRAASCLRDARDRDATRTYGMFSCSKATNEMNYIAQKFARAVIGSNNIDSCNRT